MFAMRSTCFGSCGPTLPLSGMGSIIVALLTVERMLNPLSLRVIMRALLLLRAEGDKDDRRPESPAALLDGDTRRLSVRCDRELNVTDELRAGPEEAWPWVSAAVVSLPVAPSTARGGSSAGCGG